MSCAHAVGMGFLTSASFEDGGSDGSCRESILVHVAASGSMGCVLGGSLEVDADIHMETGASLLGVPVGMGNADHDRVDGSDAPCKDAEAEDSESGPEDDERGQDRSVLLEWARSTSS